MRKITDGVYLERLKTADWQIIYKKSQCLLSQFRLACEGAKRAKIKLLFL